MIITFKKKRRRIGLNLIIGFIFCLYAVQGLSTTSNKDSLKIEAFLAIEANVYTSIHQRYKFYKKADRLFSNYGYKVRWLNAAYKTVHMLKVAHSKMGGVVAHTNDEIRTFIEIGNEVILESSLDKIRMLWRDGELLKGEKALKWDAQMLADEQHLIDPYYEQLSEASQTILDENLKRWISIHVLRNPVFVGQVTEEEARWTFGMRSMNYEVTPEMMPVPESDWRQVALKGMCSKKKRKQ